MTGGKGRAGRERSKKRSSKPKEAEKKGGGSHEVNYLSLPLSLFPSIRCNPTQNSHTQDTGHVPAFTFVTRPPPLPLRFPFFSSSNSSYSSSSCWYRDVLRSVRKRRPYTTHTPSRLVGPEGGTFAFLLLYYPQRQERDGRGRHTHSHGRKLLGSDYMFSLRSPPISLCFLLLSVSAFSSYSFFVLVVISLPVFLCFLVYVYV